jgi:hypothetical protein
MGEAPGFDDVDEAVAYGLARAGSVIVRTLACDFYWAGQEPDERDGHLRMLPWPPGDAQRRAIDAGYAEAVATAEEDRAAYEAYRAAGQAWRSRVAPHLAGCEPVHECSITVPGDADACLKFAEFDGAGEFCAGFLGPGRFAFGAAVEVLSELTAGLAGDDWRAAIGRAWDRERTWPECRRTVLDVRRGAGEMFHVTATTNRDSIQRHGLDWTRMCGAPGVAGSRDPELPVVFLCGSRFDVDFYLRMARVPCDVWAVRVEGIWIETGPHGWEIAPQPIPCDRLRIIDTDIEPNRPQ